ncbi:hypothetical protein EGW08_018910 [Elysia chlorotica]|uniref:Sushi domain-containing protein n=1 Tax=Elysia chlorotica TaxID=188477 RepID=A0A433SVY3_ELYCH|nr:hypothetical protein EGW08_018910 [Elysia chlorotica]
MRPLGLMLAIVLCSVLTAIQQNPEIEFDNQYRILFPGASLEQFYKCLCDKRIQRCQQQYKIQSSSNRGFTYVVKDPTISVYALQDEPERSSFLCHPGAFATIDSLVCVRWHNSSRPCDGQAKCGSVRVALDYETCDFNCVNIFWTNYLFSGGKFFHNPEFDIDKECVATSTSQPGGSNNESLKVAVAVGWSLFVLLLGLNVAYIVRWYRQSKLSSKRSNQAGFGLTTTGNSRLGANQTSSIMTTNSNTDRGRTLEIKHPAPEDAGGNHRYDECSPFESTDNDYNTIDEERAASAPRLSEIQARLAQTARPGCTEQASRHAPGSPSGGDGQTSPQGHIYKQSTEQIHDTGCKTLGAVRHTTLEIPNGELAPYSEGSAVQDDGEGFGDAKSSRSTHQNDYDRLTSRGESLSAEVNTNPNTYNTVSASFGGRSSPCRDDTDTPGATLYDVPRG